MHRIQDMQDAYKAMSLDAREEALKYMRILAAMSPAKPVELRLVINAKTKE